MPKCDCDSYGDLPLDRKSISQRACGCKAIVSRLDVVVAHDDGEHVLLRCATCGQHWQKSSAWNWGAENYIFKVPTITSDEWSSLPFVDPDEVLIFAARIDQFLGQQEFAAGDRQCRRQECKNTAVKGLALCLRHHVESLQQAGLLPKTPKGRWWGIYERFGPTAFERSLTSRDPST